jgi:hypothetical protein
MAIWIQLVVHKLRMFFLHHCGFLIYCTGPPNRTSEFFLGTGYSASPARSNSKGKCVMVIILKWPLSFWEVFFSNTVGFQIMLPKHLQCVLAVPLEVAAQHTIQIVMVSVPGWNEVKLAYIIFLKSIHSNMIILTILSHRTSKSGSWCQPWPCLGNWQCHITKIWQIWQVYWFYKTAWRAAIF